MAAVVNRELQDPQLRRPLRIQPQCFATGLNSSEAPLQDIDGARHRGEVDALGGGAALDVEDVAAQRLGKIAHGPLPVRAGQHPRMHHSAQGGSVGGAGQVVLDGPRDNAGPPPVAQVREQVAELVGGQQVEEHEHVGLLGCLVAVRGVVLGLEDAIKPAQVTELLAIGIPVEFLKMPVALELADNAALVERHEELAGDLLPAVDLIRLQPELIGELDAAVFRQHRQYLQRPQQDPRRHDVRVGVVVHAVRGRRRIAGVELIRPHDAVDDVPVAAMIVGGDAAPEPRDVDDHLCAVVGEELQVAGGLVVLPHVVGHGDAHVALPVSGVGQPPARYGVQVDPLALLAAVTARLPGVHGA